MMNGETLAALKKNICSFQNGREKIPTKKLNKQQTQKQVLLALLMPILG